MSMEGYIEAQLNQSKGMYERLPVLYQAIDRHIEIISDYLKGAKKILDVGCFDGYFLEKLKDKFVVKGFDLNKINIEKAKERKLDVIEWDARKGIPYKNEKFDFINVHHTFEHIPRENQKEFIVNMCDSLDDNGCLCIVVPIEDIEPTLKHPGLFNSKKQLDDFTPLDYEIVERISIIKKRSEVYYVFIKKICQKFMQL